ncbi:hypothetical protein B9T23_10465 [Acinetobacter terrae]|uniref:HEPN domain-containing protein n=1 Tax=Acinetobacter terrae TaxID=2731247 RepID=UPI000A350466|nr:HEPN domain-containing protein [Acinetobacter terrae]OTG75612.1 hypothetical protein B9T23_10465 [Acinetobacter terrae]
MLLLEEIYKSYKAQNSAHFNLRIHRGLGWFKKALELDQDLDFKFISLWISFHAIYADEGDIILAPAKLHQFLETLCQKDLDQKINHIIWEKYSQPIRSLLDNSYVDQSFWDYRNQKISLESCQAALESQKQRIQDALQERNSVEILKMIFHRLYTLHHQLMHGGITYHSSLNHKSFEESCRILAVLLPVFICILLENAKALDLNKPFYPAVQVS